MKRIVWVWFAVLASGCAGITFRQPPPQPPPVVDTVPVTTNPALQPTAITVKAPASPVPETREGTATPEVYPTLAPNPYPDLLSTQTLPDLDLAALIRYTVSLTLTEPSARVFQARSSIRYVNTSSSPLPEVVLRLYPNTPGYHGALDIHVLRVDGVGVAPTFGLENTVLQVALPHSLPPNEQVALDLQYTLRIPDGNRAGYGACNCSVGVCSLGGFYPAVAVNQDGEWQSVLVTGVGDPVHAEVALFDVTVSVPVDFVVLGSGRVVEEVSVTQDFKTWRMVGGPLRDFALVVGTGYTTVEQWHGNTAVTYSYYLPSDTKTISQVMEYAVNALAGMRNCTVPIPTAALPWLRRPSLPVGLSIRAPYSWGRAPSPRGVSGLNWSLLMRSLTNGGMDWWGMIRSTRRGLMRGSPATPLSFTSGSNTEQR